ncbi:DUF2267 domain-containing protein [Actinophytocola sp.]|jgi:uncharacterized protein (DUF2267 family)|uniref:DUF2267 domain-containing protein n=1 Tax=Actinophytocola sp. TaxID=1872138 RepID=UPI002EDAE67D
MDYRGFITTVVERADISTDEAERAACTTLHTLARRISTGEAEDLAERLPEQLRRCVDADGERETFHVDEFLRRLEEELQVDADKAEREAGAVFAALRAAVGPKEFDDMRSELPKDFEPLLDLALDIAPPEDDVPYRGTLTYDAIVGLVARRLGGDHERARRALFGVLRALAMRITLGQVEDLRPYLPLELRPALEGVPRRAVRMSLEKFLEEVARRERVDRATATQDARAVFQVLPEIVPKKEFQDTMAQLPEDFRELLREQ